MRIYKGKKYTYPIEVKCKDCNCIFKKEKWTLNKWQGRCQPCAATFTCRTRAGKTDEPMLRKIYIEATCKDCKIVWQKRQDSFKSWGGKCISCTRKLVDREAVRKNELARKEMYSLIHSTLKRLKVKKTRKSNELLGYSPQDLYTHLTNKFKEGMSWANRNLWHIDHVKPVVAFVREGITDPRIINALDNLTPLWKQENLIKSDNWTVAAK